MAEYLQNSLCDEADDIVRRIQEWRGRVVWLSYDGEVPNMALYHLKRIRNALDVTLGTLERKNAVE